MAILLVTLAVILRNRINAGLLGIALVNMMNLSQNLAALITNWTSLETSLGAIARIKEFSENTPCENLNGESIEPSVEWPADGTLIFESVSASYRYISIPL
jgi:ATP-binding cassette subfamily C (CFTR/MRP) protein 1